MTPGSEVTQNSLDLLDQCIWENIQTGLQSNHVFKYLSFHVGVFEVFWVSCFWSNLSEAIIAFQNIILGR